MTCTSVLGLKYKDGVLIAADTAGSYGSTTRYKSVERLKAISNNTLLEATGEISDFQTDALWDDGNNLGPLDIHNFLTRVMYNRRNKFDPLWNSLVGGGVKNGVKYLGSVSMIGVHYVDQHIATGFEIAWHSPSSAASGRRDMTLDEGRKLLDKALLVLFYCDRSTINKIQVANVTEDGVRISQPYALKPTWNLMVTSSQAGQEKLKPKFLVILQCYLLVKEWRLHLSRNQLSIVVSLITGHDCLLHLYKKNIFLLLGVVNVKCPGNS